LAADGGWARLDAGPSLRVGDSGPRVLALRDRLASEGFAAAAEGTRETFDAELAAALAAFQAARGLAADGVLGADTLAALNVPADAILRRIELNLERLRWLPREQPASRVEVNVPAAELVYYEDGAEALRMRAIVGASTNRTPMLAATIEAIILNPTWTVPESIARNEILPASAADPTYLERNGYSVADGRVVQAPGPQNALGQVKVDAPNRFGVYMHDTPTRGLFAGSERALSHGCVRLERPRDLASALLRGQGWTREMIDAEIARGATTRVALAAPIPVFFLYQTASIEAGRLRLFPDPYGWDDVLARALQAPQAASHARTAVAMCAARPDSAPIVQSPPQGRSR
jgi:murein L,D-transpeptidase YcbB/YkuD